VTDLEEAISLHREALELRPSPHPDRSQSLSNLGNALGDRYNYTGAATDLEEAILLLREALELRPSPHSLRSLSLNNLGLALLDRYRRTGAVADLEETISLLREALELRPFPHLHRAWSLRTLVISLDQMYDASHTLPHLQEAIFYCEELLASHYPVGHQHRLEILDRLAALLQKRSSATQPTEEDLIYVARLKAEAREILNLHEDLSNKDAR
jgi:tetratricopeptide (TPR) repeat protein